MTTATATRVETRLGDDDGARRVRTIVVSTIWSLVVLTGLLAVLHQWTTPVHGWGGSLAVGFGAAIWLCVLVGGVAGNGIHELRRERSTG